MDAIASEIYDTLGPGYTESMYHRAFEVALRDQGIPYETERIVPVMFKGKTIGNIRADLIVNGDTVIELKSLRRLNEESVTQCKRYMTILGLKKGYVMNFGGDYLQVREIDSASQVD
jgi:GxxExxY protein